MGRIRITGVACRLFNVVGRLLRWIRVGGPWCRVAGLWVRVARPVCGEGQVAVDGLVEVVGARSVESAVEPVTAIPGRVGGLNGLLPVHDLLGRDGGAVGRVEGTVQVTTGAASYV